VKAPLHPTAQRGRGRLCRTVTCFRSPSSAAFALRTRSARCFGVYASGDADADTIAAPEGVTRSPHSRQNFAEGGSSARHFEQLTTRRAPHSRQNFAWAGFSCRHAGHCINRPRAGDKSEILSRVRAYSENRKRSS
jgi:hypothetical protein